MRQIFADTFYWVALSHPKDAWHEEAKRLSACLNSARLVTTEDVLVELLTWFAKEGCKGRTHAAATAQQILHDPNTLVLPQNHAAFLSALDLYQQRLDKEYSMTDCISMQAMRCQGISEILTHDHHFTQEGFMVLFP